ncbi:MAG: serine/threonine protein kinase [Gemmatimonadetes bacterium]|nr:serine/threonine protein kinase [Gemmatimonadota bacterium]MBK9690703.1 serine/threonine protein kinase [Gemmatimonadota bacterium]
MTTPIDALADLRAQLGERYAFERELGRGGMGVVYLARDRQLDRPVALKVLPAELAANAELRERFLRETRTAASFSHPNIVPVHAVEERAGLLAFAMGFVEGESLTGRVRRSGPLTVREVVRLLQDAAYALAYAHGRGVVHRDIKPDNILIERATGRALVTDFGIAREIAPVAARPGLTRVGEVVGTPEFMSPEQASGDTVDGRSDLYALGLTAYFALTGTPVFTGTSTQQLLVKQLTEPAPPIASLRPDIPAALAAAIDRLVRKEAAERFATAEALVEALETAQLAGPEVPLPVRLFAQDAGQASLILVGAIIIGWLLLQVLGQVYGGDLDVVLPVVMFAAVVWGRLAQTVQQARRLRQRGFDVADIQAGFRAILAEREAERAQLRTDLAVVARRRRQLVILVAMFAATFALQWWVKAAMRTEVRPGWFEVSRPGVFIIVSAYVMRGLAIIGILRSPLRAPIGERLFRLFWAGAPGRAILAAAGGRGPRPPGGVTLPPSSRPVPPPAARAAATAPAAGEDRLARLESRVSDLEQWREAGGGPGR